MSRTILLMLSMLPFTRIFAYRFEGDSLTAKTVYLSMMDRMMEQMEKQSSAVSPEVDFLVQMIPHHQGAIDMAEYEIDHGRDFNMLQLAKSIRTEQQIEVNMMRLWLSEGALPKSGLPGSYRPAMDLAMSTMMGAMMDKGYSEETDLVFAQIMIPHHQAAVDMAKVILKYSSDIRVTSFAKQLISNEQIEIEQMTYKSRSSLPYAYDRVYTANQVSNSISVIDPSTDKFLGEIRLGNPYPNVLSPLYKGLALVHGLRYNPQRRMLAAVGIGSNSVTLISTESNRVLKTIYVGRSPHEPAFTPDGMQIWTSVRGEAYISVVDVASLSEIRQIPVADGPGMVSFSPDGKVAYVCSSFTPEVDVVDTKSYTIIKRIPVVSPFSPNIFTSPKGEFVALTHKDVGKVTVLDAGSLTVIKVLNTGAITNHVTFSYLNNRLMMLVTVGGENKIRVFDVADDFRQKDTVNVGALPHGLWASADGKQLYVGLEFGDSVQHIDLRTMKVMAGIRIGQSPQALVYADNAVSGSDSSDKLTALNDISNTQVVEMINTLSGAKARGRLAVRPIGLTVLVEQLFNMLDPNTAYTLALTRSGAAPYKPDYEINSFTTDAQGKYLGQSTGLIHRLIDKGSEEYKHVILIKANTKQLVMVSKL